MIGAKYEGNIDNFSKFLESVEGLNVEFSAGYHVFDRQLKRSAVVIIMAVMGFQIFLQVCKQEMLDV